MSAWSTLIKNVLDAGTWTNLGSTPITHILYSGSIRVKPPCNILEDDDEDITSDHQGKVLFSKKSGLLTAIAANETARDNMKLDIHAILQTSSLSYQITSEKPNEPQKNRFEQEFNIVVLD